MKKTKDIPFLHDEIIINILARLPAKSAMRCRLVCRRWRDLTLTRYFVESQYRNSNSTILVCKSASRFEDEWFEFEETIIYRLPFYFRILPKRYRVECSYAGLILLQEYYKYGGSKGKFIILNPARPSNECLSITFPRELNTSRIYGVYFNPLLQEYCALLEIVKFTGSLRSMWNQPSMPACFKILNLGSNPSLKAIRYPYGNRLKFAKAEPLLINQYLYWRMHESEQDHKYSGRNDIMQFDIRSEEFTLIPCHVPLNTNCLSHQTHLLNIDGILSFVLILSSEITIWRLEDHAERLWTVAKYMSNLKLNVVYRWKPLSVVDGKLAIWSRGLLYVCNLMKGTANWFHKKEYDYDVYFLSHQISLATLKNCKSTIFIDKDGEVVQDKQKLDRLSSN